MRFFCNYIVILTFFLLIQDFSTILGKGNYTPHLGLSFIKEERWEYSERKYTGY